MRVSIPTLSRLTIVAAIIGTPCLARADILGFGDFSQFTYNQNDTGSPPTISTGAITITDGGSGEARSLFFNTPQDISKSFTASFTYQIPPGSSTVFDFDPSAAFVIQNSPQGLHAVGTSGEDFGYSGITNSAAVSLQLVGNGATGGGLSSLFTGGNVGTSMSTNPVILTLGDPISVQLHYDPSKNQLVETLKDTITSAEYSKTFLINLAGAVGSTSAYVGFTAATDNGGFNPPQSQTLSDFRFTSVPEPSTFAMLASALLLPLCRLLTRCRKAFRN